MKTVMCHFGSHGMERSDFGMMIPEDKTKVMYYALGTAALFVAYLMYASKNYGR